MSSSAHRLRRVVDARRRIDPLQVIAATALLAAIIVLLLPLHFRGSGNFGNAFPPGVGTRLTIGFLIRDFTLPVVIAIGLILVWCHQRPIASGVFLAGGVFSFLDGSTAPFYALPRLQPMLLLALMALIGCDLIVAAWLARGRPAGPPLPPPP